MRRELARLDPADDPDARDVTALEEVSWDVLGMEYTTGAALHYLSSMPQRLGSLRNTSQRATAHYDPVSWRLGYMVAPDEVVRMAHFTFECLRLRFEADAPAALGDEINDHRLENISRMKDRAGEQWLRQRPTDASLYYAVSVREENIVGAVRDAASPTTQLTARAWLFVADAAPTDESGFARDPENVNGDAVPVFSADVDDSVHDNDEFTRELTRTPGYFHLARKVSTVPVTDRASMFTDRLVPLVDALVRYCVEDANVRVCNYTP